MAETTDEGVAGCDVSGVRTRAELGAVLEGLRARSGRSLRDLATEISSRGASTPIGASALGDWFRGDRLPLPSRYGVFRRTLGLLGVDDPEPFIAAVVRVRDAPTRHAGRGDPAPYPGLKAYGPSDAHRFFGRDDLAAQALDRFRQVAADSARARILWIVGASGAGKSSLLHAGLCPRLAEQGHICLRMTPGSQPVTRLVDVLGGHLDQAAVACVAGLLSDPPTWEAAAGDGRDPERPALVLVVDQFEELFRECDERQQQTFVRSVTALTAPGSPVPCVMVGALRSDFFPDVTAHADLVGSLQDAQIVVTALDRSQLTDAIVEPARQVGMSVEPNLVDLLLRDFIPTGSVGGLRNPGALPLLAHALLETWKHARRGRMTIDDYARSGGVERAIEESAERIHAELKAVDRELLRQVFVRLVHVEDDGIATRRAVSYAELEGLAHLEASEAGDGGNVAPEDTERSPIADIVDRFVEARLLTAHETTVEIAHESLLTAWPRLGAWIEEDRDALRVHQRIADATRQWIDGGRDPELLASGLGLEVMRSTVAARSPTLRLTHDEQDFLMLSQARLDAAEATRRRQSRRLRALAAIAAVCALLAAALAAVTNRARDDAVHARNEALSRQMAVTARSLRETDPTVGAQLAAVGYQVAPTLEARSALVEYTAVPIAERHLNGSGSATLAVARNGELVAVGDSADGAVNIYEPTGSGLAVAGSVDLDTPDAAIYAVALTPDGRTLAIGDSGAGTISLWDVANPRSPRSLGAPLPGPTGAFARLALAPSGHELVATGDDQQVYRWTIDEPSSPRAAPLSIPGRTSTSAAYADDGQTLALGDDSGHVELWDVSAEPTILIDLAVDPASSVLDVGFAPGSHLLATATGNGGTVDLWDVTSRERPERLMLGDNHFESWANSVAFSPDGALLAAGSSDLSLRVWDTSTSALVLELPHPAHVTQVAFLPDDHTLLSAAADGTLRVWDLSRLGRTRIGGKAWGLSFSTDGDALAAFSGEETEVWDTPELGLTPPGAPITARGTVSGAGDMTSDGNVVALGTVEGSVELIDISERDDPRPYGPPLTESTKLIESLAFDADDALLAAGGDDGTVRVWNVDEPTAPDLVATLDEPAEFVYTVAWSPSAPLLAAGGADDKVHLYDLRDPADPRHLAVLGGLRNEVYSAVFSPDGATLAVGGIDGVTILWDISDPSRPRRIGQPLTGPTSQIVQLTFDPRGERLAAAVVDGTAWMWDVADIAHPEVTMVLGATSAVHAVAFRPTDDALATTGADGEVRMWMIDPQAAIADICSRIGDPITRAEWSDHSTGVPYDPPC